MRDKIDVGDVICSDQVTDEPFTVVMTVTSPIGRKLIITDHDNGEDSTRAIKDFMSKELEYESGRLWLQAKHYATRARICKE